MFCDIINEYSLLCTSFSKILDSNENHKFEVPQRAVFTPEDVKKWEQSNAYQDIIGFLTAMNTAVKGKKLSVECAVSPVTVGLLNMLDTISHWIDDIPPVDQPQRYGNTAFRDFYAKLKENGEQVVKEALSEDFHAAVPEITVYLLESVGNSTRIDYGTGHELSFILFLTCIFKIGALKQEDSIAVVTKIFMRYLTLSRKLQMVYKMEPAGSQGVWSLDDYQFIPFIWGSSQLQMNPKIAPEMFSNEKIVNENADEYMFLACIKFILSVLHKFPVVQHMLFGSILSISPAKEITYHPPGTEISSMRNPSMSSATGGQGFMPPRASAVASQGRVSMTDRMPVHISQMSKMPQDLPFNDISSVMPPVSKTPQGLSTVDKVSSNMLTTSKTSLPCAEERHPAMSPLNSLPPDIFPKATKHTQ
ncbi:serine/threonine-protein phosphatase 2A activator isoform X4 [Cherax quadricarinatus]|uniref:serine/threonine-protein phosphatase 2A activator isoform X4 n=1 Tax=Cherax quadricarinatus TaxID=27406 RepID=UPI00387E8228